MPAKSNMQSLGKLKAGDQVAVISPSSGLPEVFPWVQDLGLKRMREVFGLIPVEYRTTRKMNSTLKDRAEDIMTAFTDQKNKAVFTTIGGNDQIKLIKYLDPKVFIDNPKPFFGYSDNTHLHNFLWNLGIPSYYGGGIMTQFAMNQAMFDQTVGSIQLALFNKGFFEVVPSEIYNDEGLDWSNEENLLKKRKIELNDGWFWDGSQSAEGRLWGGCMESLIVQVATEKYLPDDQALEDVVFFIETAEDIPEHWVIEYLLTGFGERGWLNKFKAVLVGRPKAWEFDKQKTAAQKELYRKEQRKVIIDTVRQYNKNIPIIQNMDFGHTDPQIIVPMGQKAKIDSSNQKIFFEY